MDDKLTVSVVLISFNTKDLTIRAIDALLIRTKVALEVIVVDNASSDGSADAISHKFQGISLIRSERNLGFGSACNVAAEIAQAPYLLLLNPDTEVLDNSIDNLVKFAENYPDAGIWGGRTIFEDGSLNPGSCWRRQTLWSLMCSASGLTAAFKNSPIFNPEGYGGWQRDNVRYVDIVSGCFLLVKMSLWKKLQGFDPIFFMYGEDADLCLRAIKLGARPMVTPEATIIHHAGASESIRADKILKLYRAKLQLMDRHWGPLSSMLGRWLLLANVLRRRILHRTAKKLNSKYDFEESTFDIVWKRRQEFTRTG